MLDIIMISLPTDMIGALIFLAILLSGWFVVHHISGLTPKLVLSIGTVIPRYGTAIEFGLDAMGFLKRYQQRYGSTYEVHLAGRRLIVVNHLGGILDVLRNKALDLPSNQMLEALGGEKQDNPSTVYHAFATCVSKHFSNKCIPQLSPTFTSYLFHRIQTLARPAPDERISLQEFVSRLLYDAVSVAVWGTHYPLDSYNEFQIIDSNLPCLLGPRMLLPRTVRNARDTLKGKVGAYIKNCWDEEEGMKGSPKAASDMIRCLRSSHPSVKPEEVQTEIIAFLFALHSNTHRISTWLLLHILSDTQVITSLRKEVDHAVEFIFGDLETLLAATPQQLGPSSLPLLNSAIIETLRLWHTGVSVREVVEEVKIPAIDHRPPLTVYRGDMVMANGYAINMSDQYFEDCGTFKMDRFVNNATLEKRNNLGITPIANFGGGMHVCKGRDFALYEMKIFVILCLRLLDIQAETESGVDIHGREHIANPRLTIPGFAMFPNDQVFVRIGRRTE